MDVKPIRCTSRFFRRYTEGTSLVAVAVLGALVIGGPANAAPSTNALGGPILHSNSSAPPVPDSTKTSIALATSPVSPVANGTKVTLTATVTPATAAGNVQFKDGTVNISNPVTVSNGTASRTTSNLAAGSHQLTAAFIPTDTAAFGSSTSPAVTFMVTDSTGKGTGDGLAPPVAASPFALEIDGVVIKHILDVSGLPGQPTGGEVTVTRRLTDDNSLQKWMEDSRRNPSGARKGGAITLYDSKGMAMRRYKLTNASPKILEIGTMKTGDTSVPTEKLGLAYESIDPA